MLLLLKQIIKKIFKVIKKVFILSFFLIFNQVELMRLLYNSVARNSLMKYENVIYKLPL